MEPWAKSLVSGEQVGRNGTREAHRFIDNTGKLVIDYDRLPSSTALVGEFHEGRAVIYLNRVGTPVFTGYDVGFIDETGNMVIPPRFRDARPFSEGLAYVNGTEFRGFIDLSGQARNQN